MTPQTPDVEPSPTSDQLTVDERMRKFKHHFRLFAISFAAWSLLGILLGPVLFSLIGPPLALVFGLLIGVFAYHGILSLMHGIIWIIKR